MMTKRAIITAVLDANVIYPAPLRDYLLYLAGLKVYYPLWTDEIQEEWGRSLLKARPDIDGASVAATRRSMDREFYGSKLTGYELIIESLSLPDPGDRHVLAAAIKGGADVIVTANLKDFPRRILDPYNIRAEHPDDFVLTCITREKENAVKALENQVKFLKNPPLSIEKVLGNLGRCGLVKSVEKLRGYLQ